MPEREITRWHLGFRYAIPNGHRWASRWVTHPCRDLALPFELGARAAHHAPAGPIAIPGQKNGGRGSDPRPPEPSPTTATRKPPDVTVANPPAPVAHFEEPPMA